MNSQRNIDRLGAIDSIAKFDADESRKRKWDAVKLGPAFYPGVDADPENLNIIEKEVTYRKRVSHWKNKDLFVLSSVSGLGREALAQYKNYPPEVAEEYIKDAIRADIEYAGMAVTEFKIETSDHKNAGFVVSWSGLNSAQAYTDVDPCDVMVADLPDKDHLMKHHLEENTMRGRPRTKFEMITRPIDPASAGQRLRRTMKESLLRGAAYQKLLGGKTRRHVQASLNMCQKLLKRDLFVSVAVQYAKDIHGDPTHAGNVRVATAKAIASAKELGLIGHVDAAKRKLQHTIVNVLYTDGYNRMYQMGGQQGVHPKTGRVNISTDAGKLLNLQLNSFVGATTSYSQAVLDEHRWIVGKAVVGAQKGGRYTLVQGLRQ